MTLTVLSLLLGVLIVSTSTALLSATWLSSAGSEIAAQSLALASVCGLGFATLGGWLTALVAQRAPLAHAIALSLLLAITWGLYTFTGNSTGPLTLSLLNITISIAGVMTGGWIRLAQIEKREQLREHTISSRFNYH